jgi:hypothetical protein
MIDRPVPTCPAKSGRPHFKVFAGVLGGVVKEWKRLHSKLRASGQFRVTAKQSLS